MTALQTDAATGPAPHELLSHAAERIGAGNRSAHAPLLEDMHRDRKTVFIDQLKWDLPATDGLEIDEYDHDDAIYLVVPDPQTGAHLGSVRLLPSTGPHLLGDKFAGLCAEGVPRGPHVFELTRMLTRPGLSRPAALRVRQHLAIAITEYAIENGISQLTMMTHMAYLSNVIAVGWDCEPLGLPQEHDGVAIAALLVGIDTATLTRLRTQYGINAPVLRRAQESALAA